MILRTLTDTKILVYNIAVSAMGTVTIVRFGDGKIRDLKRVLLLLGLIKQRKRIVKVGNISWSKAKLLPLFKSKTFNTKKKEVHFIERRRIKK